MADIYRPLTPFPDKTFKSVFLAGSIEMGQATNWQETVEEALGGADLNIFNPRRLDWNPNWVQDINNPDFKAQVLWELEGLDKADLVIVHFEAYTRSPITLFELGLNVRKPMIVHCAENFWRKGNVDIVCEKFHIPQVKSVEELAPAILKYFKL